MLWLYRFLKGYVTVLFEGEFCEKILNLTAQNRISLWDSRLNKKGITSSVLAGDFIKLRKILRKSGIRVHILEKKGLPFKTAKYNKRAGLLIGAVIFVLFLKIMSDFIWVIDIVGNENVKNEEILSACQEIGIKEGIHKSKIHTKTDRERLLLKLDKLAWASLNIEGSRLTVNVSESKKKEETLTSSNLKATADGIIKKIDIVSGNCVVKTGDTVKKGDILVSGVIEKLSSTHFVRSAGTVIAETKRSITVESRYKTEKTLENGKQKRKKVLEIFTLKIPLYLGEENGEYRAEKSVKALKLFGQELPIRVYIKDFTFYDKYKITYQKEQLLKELDKKLAEKLEKEGVENFTVENQKYYETADGLKLEALISSEENIATEEKMLISEQN